MRAKTPARPTSTQPIRKAEKTDTAFVVGSLTNAVLALPRLLTRDTFGDALVVFASSDLARTKCLTVSFRRTQFADIAGLLALTAFAASRYHEHLVTKIGAPDSLAVRDFLVLWRYPAALAKALRSSPREIVSGSAQWLDEAPETYLRKTDGVGALELNRRWSESAQSDRRNFFEFETFLVGDSDLDLPRLEAARWNDKPIKAVLSTHLKEIDTGDEDHVSRVVVFESMANAVQHPRASLVQTASVFQSQQENGKDPHFRLCVWDDGESMISTLREAVNKPDAKLRADGWHDAWCDYIQTIEYSFDADQPDLGQTNEYRFDQKLNPTSNSSDVQLLLSCFSPGITSTFVRGRRNAANGTVPLHAPAAGMGLYTLLRTMVDRYHGTISVRTGEYLLRLAAARGYRGSVPTARYEARVYRRPRLEPKFPGNLLTMTIPCHRRSLPDDGTVAQRSSSGGIE